MPRLTPANLLPQGAPFQFQQNQFGATLVAPFRFLESAPEENFLLLELRGISPSQHSPEFLHHADRTQLGGELSSVAGQNFQSL